MKPIIFALCGAVALLVEVPAQAAAHPQGVAARTTISAALAPAGHSAPIGARAVAGGVRFEQHGRGTVARAPRGSAPVGVAASRGRAPFGRGFRGRPFFFSPYAFGGFGLGFAYDPFLWGYGGYPFGWGYPYWGWGYPYGPYGYGYGYYRYPGAYSRYGSVKLDVKPTSAEVYADGYYMGQVHDFDGTFHHLDLRNGDHRIEIRENGYQPLTVNIRITPGRTVTYRGDLPRGSSPAPNSER